MRNLQFTIYNLQKGRIGKLVAINLGVFLIFLFPLAAMAQGGIQAPTGKLIVCNGPDCQFDHVIQLINTIVEYFFYAVVLAVVFAAIYAGFLLVTSGGNQSARTKAIGVFTKIGWGALWLLGGYLLIKIIVDGLVNPDSIFKFL